MNENRPEQETEDNMKVDMSKAYLINVLTGHYRFMDQQPSLDSKVDWTIMLVKAELGCSGINEGEYSIKRLTRNGRTAIEITGPGIENLQEYERDELYDRIVEASMWSWK